jgi:hypothetical protein
MPQNMLAGLEDELLIMYPGSEVLSLIPGLRDRRIRYSALCLRGINAAKR